METTARTVPARIGEWLLKIAGLFVILEPLWMLLPFAGFLYGSVLRIENLNRRPSTAWLTHFVFPVLTLGWTGPVLVLSGLAVFLVGASQIYYAKMRRTGLVTRGLYRFVRHPQYIALTLFGLGLLLAWGRAIMFIAFFVMMFLYRYLAKSEERNCVRLFGDAYERYRERTSFIFPGDRRLRPLGARLAALGLPAPARVAGAFIFTMLLCFGLMWLVKTVKDATRTVPYMTATVPFAEEKESEGARPKAAARTRMPITAGEAGGIPFVQSGRVAVVRGPYRNAAATGFAERVLVRLRRSKTLRAFLAFLDERGGDVLIVWCGPYEKPEEPGGLSSRAHADGSPDRRGPPVDPHGPDRVRLILMRCALQPGATVADALADRTKRKIVGGCVAQVNVARPEDEDMVEGDGKTRGPGFPGEERWTFFMDQFAERFAGQRATSAKALPAVALPGRFTTARLVLVQAPILRTRLDPAFAREVLDRLLASATFRDRLRKSGAGGDIVAVAFPRPGPNWYREHHGKPEISPFVILARLRRYDRSVPPVPPTPPSQRPGAGPGWEAPEAPHGCSQGAALDDLFRRDGRDLASAFIVDMDFGIDRAEDGVREITMVGPRRDLEERWRFFLSGVGGAVVHEH